MEASAVPGAASAGAWRAAPPRLLRLSSDDRLAGLVRAGHPRAFEAVYNRHHRAIFVFCRHLLGSPEEAEDAVQHTFLAAYNGLAASEREINLRPWLFTVARNRCLSVLRARREYPAGELPEPATEGLAAQVLLRQDLRDLVHDLGRLPGDQRAALVLAEMESLSHGEIAEVLQVPRQKVKALVFQARESLLAVRQAREADCREIREQLATVRGAALRRGEIRRHLALCGGCRDYRAASEQQRHRLALVLPVAPTVALKETIIAATVGGGAAGAGAAGTGLLAAGSALKGLAATRLLASVIAGLGTAGTFVAVHAIPGVPPRSHHPRTAVARVAVAPVARPLRHRPGRAVAAAPSRILVAVLPAARDLDGSATPHTAAGLGGARAAIRTERPSPTVSSARHRVARTIRVRRTAPHARPPADVVAALAVPSAPAALSPPPDDAPLATIAAASPAAPPAGGDGDQEHGRAGGEAKVGSGDGAGSSSGGGDGSGSGSGGGDGSGSGSGGGDGSGSGGDGSGAGSRGGDGSGPSAQSAARHGGGHGN